MKKVVDRTGLRYGSLTAVSLAERIGRPIRWNCICDCGKQVVVNGTSLGRTNSCGCSRKKHGMHDYSVYKIWTGIKQRCLNPDSQNYWRYGAKGLGICDRWLTFENFLSDMGPRPNGASVDRIDGKKGYCPENCRWATSSEQANNTSTNIWIEHNGERLTAAQWAHKLGGTRQLIRDRLKRGWSVADAVTTPHVSTTKHFMPDGRPGWVVAVECGVGRSLFLTRVNKLGWDVVRAATTPVKVS
jgi:hypothetical protein